MSASQSCKTYDVVIVGGGIAGAILAKTLVNAGQCVLVLDAGDGVTLSDDVNGVELDGHRHQKANQSNLQRFYEAAAKVPNSPYVNQPAAPSPDVLNIVRLQGQPSTRNGYFVQTGPRPYSSDYIRTPGGTTNHWLGTCLRMVPNDFQLKTQYGVGVDWPITYHQLRPYYEMAEREIGVSANVEHQNFRGGENMFGDDYVFPMHELPPSYMDQTIEKALGCSQIQVSDGAGGKVNVEVKLTPTPQGRNSTPNADYRYKRLRWDGCQGRLVWDLFAKHESYESVGSNWDPYTGQRCEGNASCVPICPVQAKYNALKTLNSVVRNNDGTLNPLLDIVYRAVVSAVLVDQSNPASGCDRPVIGIKYRQYEINAQSKLVISTTERIATGKRYVLAAHAIENAKILLASGIANSSDQVGRNLMDHLVLLTWGLMDQPVFPFRGPGSTSNIPVFRDGQFRKEHASFIVPLDNWGWGWPTFSPGTDLDAALDQGLYGTELKAHLEHQITRQVTFHFECEQLPEQDNRVTIDPQYKDDIGNYRPVIRYDVSEYVQKGFAASKAVSDQLFQAAGICDKSNYSPGDACHFNYEGQDYFYRGAGHFIGTHRMGSKRDDSVVNVEQRTWDHSNLFLVGCGNMPTCGTSNPTLTMAALAFMATEHILKDLNGLN